MGCGGWLGVRVVPLPTLDIRRCWIPHDVVSSAHVRRTWQARPTGKADLMLLDGYDVAVASQVAAFFALKSGGQINVLKLSKLLYLAEREYMKRYDEPMFYDKLCSMPDGPVASITLNLINGNLENEVWSDFIAPRGGYEIKIQPGVALDGLDHLSAADVELLELLWGQFGKMGKYAIRDWTHIKENVPEWEDPAGSSKPIRHEDVFRHLGKDDADGLTASIAEHREISALLNQ